MKTNGGLAAVLRKKEGTVIEHLLFFLYGSILEYYDELVYYTYLDCRNAK